MECAVYINKNGGRRYKFTKRRQTFSHKTPYCVRTNCRNPIQKYASIPKRYENTTVFSWVYRMKNCVSSACLKGLRAKRFFFLGVLRISKSEAH